MKTINYFFASANTGSGFVSYLDNLNTNSKNAFTYIIKGGPGTGKSTMMKKISQHFYEKGYSVEQFFCSTDPTSLDAIRIVQKNIVVLDGTMPHAVEPDIVGLTHKIIDNGSFIKSSIKKHFDEIENLTNKKKDCFCLIYKNLASAKQLDDINFELEKKQINLNSVKQKAKTLFSKIKCLCPEGENRTLFLDSINDENLYLEKKNKFKVLGFTASRYESFFVLEMLEKMLIKNNLNYTKICDVLNPEKISAILISNKYLIKNIDLKLKTNKLVEKNNKIVKKIINLSKNKIVEAKSIHKQIEKYYIQNIDFSGLEEMTRKVIEEIELG
ncbi:MAG: hypothetical protein IJF22_02980 [Clostridia bacterium]|nr:hypothetical protein [Clostridia bacterium]